MINSATRLLQLLKTTSPPALIALALSLTQTARAQSNYAAVASSPGYGAVALWPLNETVDPSSPGGAVAYDIIGGFNGTYATNANNGGGNASNHFSAVAGPAAAGLIGLPAGGALGPNPSMGRTYVGTTNSPLFPGLTSGAGALTNSTNMTIVAWINPNIYPENEFAGILCERSGTFGATRSAAFRYYGNTQLSHLGYSWNNTSGTATGFDTGLVPPVGVWSMVALVISESNAVFYLGNASQGLQMAVQNVVWPNEPWGKGVSIGDDPGGAATGRAFSGAISSVTMFSNSLSTAQIVNLFTAGEGSYAAVAGSAGYGAVALWPLNETVDPSSPGGAVAYDIIGGFNGTYGTNANNGGGNASNSFSPIAGPAAAGLTGLPSGGALGPNPSMGRTYVGTTNSPLFPGLTSGAGALTNSTNMTIVAWINPNIYPENEFAGILCERSGTFGATRSAAFRYYGNTQLSHLGYSWNNTSGTATGFDTGLVLPVGVWSMVALVISESNAVFYLGNASQGMQTAVQNVVWPNEPWGKALALETTRAARRLAALLAAPFLR